MKIFCGKIHLGMRIHFVNSTTNSEVLFDDFELVEVSDEYTVVSTSDYYPLGMEIEGRSGPVDATTNLAVDKFKYQTKERDLETGYDYFEARLYNSAIGRFMQVDPAAEQYTSHSPYHGMANNPRRITDPTGAFWFDVHNAIIKRVVGNAKYYAQLTVVSLLQDIVTSNYKSHEHFDNFTKGQSGAGWNFVNSSINSATVHGLGEAFHAAQDFYFHSNFSDLAGQVFEDKIVTFNEAMENTEFANLWKDKGRSGIYDEDDKKATNSEHGHNQMNYDFFPNISFDILLNPFLFLAKKSKVALIS